MGVLPAAPDSIAAALAAGRDVALWPGGEVDSLPPWQSTPACRRSCLSRRCASLAPKIGGNCQDRSTDIAGAAALLHVLDRAQ
jgi:hypothetical protein